MFVMLKMKIFQNEEYNVDDMKLKENELFRFRDTNQHLTRRQTIEMLNVIVLNRILLKAHREIANIRQR